MKSGKLASQNCILKVY